MADFPRKERVKNALDHNKLNLSAPCPAAKGKWSSLIWGFHANNPRISVYTNDPEDTGEKNGYGKISANLDTPTFFVFLRLLAKIVSAEPDTKYKIENMNFTWFGGKRSETPVMQSELWVGKDKEGVVYMSVTSANRPKIKFPFGVNSFHHLVKGDGSAVSPAEASMLYAEAYGFILQGMLTSMAVSHWIEPEKKDNSGNRSGGSGGGGNWKGGGGNSGGGSGGGRTEAAVEDDIPW